MTERFEEGPRVYATAPLVKNWICCLFGHRWKSWASSYTTLCTWQCTRCDHKEVYLNIIDCDRAESFL